MSAVIEKQRIADSFSRAASTYDSVAALQRAVGEQLLTCLADDQPVQCMADLGCGTGYFTPALRAQYPQAQLLNLDLARGMLAYARRERPDQNACWIAADAEQLPLADKSVELVFSSLAVQWCHDEKRLFSELARVLKPAGRAVIATLGPRTLHELKAAWGQVDQHVHVNPFTGSETLQASLPENLQCTALHTEMRTLEYRELRDLTHELKALGAHNMNAGQADGLTGRQRLKAFQQAYEGFRCNGLLPASYEIYYLTLEKS